MVIQIPLTFSCRKTVFSVLSFALIFTACQVAVEPKRPGKWLKEGVYELQVKIESFQTQTFSGKSYRDTAHFSSVWNFICLKTNKDTLWGNLAIKRVETEAGVAEIANPISGIVFRVVRDNLEVDKDSLLAQIFNLKNEVLFDHRNDLGIAQRRLLSAWLQPMSVHYLLAVLFQCNPGLSIFSGRSWEGLLPVWHPIPGAFSFKGNLTSFSQEEVVAGFTGAYINKALVNPASLLPLGGTLRGKMTGGMTLSTSKSKTLAYWQVDSLSGNLQVAGRNVPADIVVKTEIGLDRVKMGQ